MNTPDGRDRMLKRHEIVVRIIEGNSRALRSENEMNGLDIERRNAERALQSAPSEATRQTLEAIEERMRQLDAQREKLLIEKAWLEQTLDDFDCSPTEPAAAQNQMGVRRGS